jgi:hypothetical protein
MESFTKRSHYNPCFWTAHWNPVFYAASLQSSAPPSLPVREQMVYTLSVKSGKLLHRRVEDVHFDKGGPVEITREEAEAFCLKYHPEQYDEFKKANADTTYPLFIEPEQLFTIMESLPSYRTLIEVIRRRNIVSAEEKCWLASFVALHFLRSHAILNAILEWHATLGIGRYESFMTLKWDLANQERLTQRIVPILLRRWILYSLDEDAFPLTDSPILIRPANILVALSPRLLLEIQTNVAGREDEWHTRRSIKPGKLADFRKRTIGNTFRDIIFGSADLLERWAATKEFKDRHLLMRDTKNYNLLVKEQSREFYHLNAFGWR